MKVLHSVHISLPLRPCLEPEHVLGLPRGFPTKVLYAYFTDECCMLQLLASWFNHLYSVRWREQIVESIVIWFSSFV